MNRNHVYDGVGSTISYLEEKENQLNGQQSFSICNWNMNNFDLEILTNHLTLMGKKSNTSSIALSSSSAMAAKKIKLSIINLGLLKIN